MDSLYVIACGLFGVFFKLPYHITFAKFKSHNLYQNLLKNDMPSFGAWHCAFVVRLVSGWPPPGSVNCVIVDGISFPVPGPLHSTLYTTQVGKNIRRHGLGFHLYAGWRPTRTLRSACARRHQAMRPHAESSILSSSRGFFYPLPKRGGCTCGSEPLLRESKSTTSVNFAAGWSPTNSNSTMIKQNPCCCVVPNGGLAWMSPPPRSAAPPSLSQAVPATLVPVPWTCTLMGTIICVVLATCTSQWFGWSDISSHSVAERLTHALLTSRLDSCSSNLLCGLPGCTGEQAAALRNTAAHMVTRTKGFEIPC